MSTHVIPRLFPVATNDVDFDIKKCVSVQVDGRRIMHLKGLGHEIEFKNFAKHGFSYRYRNLC